MCISNQFMNIIWKNMNMNHGHDNEQNYIPRVILPINANHIEGNNGSYYFFSTLAW
jgi:hypothetical protein